MAELTIEQTFDLAVQHHQAGRLGQAEQLYRQILSQQKHVGALQLLGVIADQVGRHDVAADLIRQSIALSPNQPGAYYNLGNALSHAGLLDEAIAAYQQAISLKPDHAEAHSALGAALRKKGLLDQAITAYRQAIALKPNLAEAHNNLGSALNQQGHLDQAIAAYRQAIALKPNLAEAHNSLGHCLAQAGLLDEAIAAHRQAVALRPAFAEAYSSLGVALARRGCVDEAIVAHHQAIALRPDIAEAHSNLGISLNQQHRHDEAIAAHRQAISLKPDLAEAHCNLGVALRDKGQWDEAIAEFRRAIALKPSFAEAHNNLGNALWEQDRLDEAIAAYRDAVTHGPNSAEAHNNLGNVLREKGHLDEAIACCHRSIALQPDYPEAHHNLALALLLKGDLLQGWKEYEWRWQCKEIRASRREFRQAQWDGRPLQGRTILLHAEQGFGDTLKFIRYVPMVIDRGGRAIVECQPPLQRLLQTMNEAWPVVARGAELPEFELQCPLMSLAMVFGTTLESIPAHVPYLRADAAEVEKWRKRFTSDSMKVGLAWAGRPTQSNDRQRSTVLANFAPLAKVSGVRFYSLQKGEAASQASAPPAGMDLIDWTEDLHDFADTAALIANLDLIITVDTSVAHLAGAMGKPVWTLLSFAAAWHWMIDRQDSPWYPTMRLYRQPSAGDWDTVMNQAAESLADLAHRS